MLRAQFGAGATSTKTCFNGHPPLGVNATGGTKTRLCLWTGFNGHPPLGVNATELGVHKSDISHALFQWAPTLGGECYDAWRPKESRGRSCFNGHPPLGVNATRIHIRCAQAEYESFNGHPPLGVNATGDYDDFLG